eukprot:5707782-Amphidinium_carterae.1
MESAQDSLNDAQSEKSSPERVVEAQPSASMSPGIVAPLHDGGSVTGLSSLTSVCSESVRGGFEDDDQQIEEVVAVGRPKAAAAAENKSDLMSYPRWRCKPCHSGVRALERAAKSRGEESFAKFSEMRRNKPLQFNEL